MALHTKGSIDHFSVRAKQNVAKNKPFLESISTFSDLSEISRDVAPNSFDLITSTDQRAVGLKRIKLIEGFEGYLQKYLDPVNEVYFLAWAWDLSGQPINQYPGSNVNSTDVVMQLKVGNVREFIGAGINLFPKRLVKGGVALRIQLWESDQNVRNFGKAMTDTANEIKKSELNNLLSLISTAAGVSGATISLIKDASIELVKAIGIILRTNGDDHVDFFEGYYPADQTWTIGDDQSQGSSSMLTLNKY